MFKLTSPYVVHIYGILVEPDPGLYAIVMEHMVYGSISDVIEVTMGITEFLILFKDILKIMQTDSLVRQNRVALSIFFFLLLLLSYIPIIFYHTYIKLYKNSYCLEIIRGLKYMK